MYVDEVRSELIRERERERERERSKYQFKVLWRQLSEESQWKQSITPPINPTSSELARARAHTQNTHAQHTQNVRARESTANQPKIRRGGGGERKKKASVKKWLTKYEQKQHTEEVKAEKQLLCNRYIFHLKIQHRNNYSECKLFQMRYFACFFFFVCVCVDKMLNRKYYSSITHTGLQAAHLAHNGKLFMQPKSSLKQKDRSIFLATTAANPKETTLHYLHWSSEQRHSKNAENAGYRFHESWYPALYR